LVHREFVENAIMTKSRKPAVLHVTHVSIFKCIRNFTKQSTRISFIIKTQTWSEKSLEWATKIGVAQSVWFTLARIYKRYLLFYFLIMFMIFLSFICTDRYIHKIIPLNFTYVSHAPQVFTATVAEISGKPEVLPTLFVNRNDEP